MNREELTRRVREKLETMSLEELGSLAGLEALDMSGMNTQQRVVCLLEVMELDMLAGMLSIPLEPVQPQPATEPPKRLSLEYMESDTGDGALHGHMLEDILPKGSGDMVGTKPAVTPAVGILSDPEPTRPRVRVSMEEVMEQSRQREAAEKEKDMLKKHETNTPMDTEQPWLNRRTRRAMMVAGAIFMAMVLLNSWVGSKESAKMAAEEKRATLEMTTKAIEAIATSIAEKKVAGIQKDVARLQDDTATARQMLGKAIINVGGLTLLTKGHQDVLVQHTKQLQSIQLQKVTDELERLKRKLDTVDALDRATPKPVAAEPPAPKPIYDGDEATPAPAEDELQSPAIAVSLSEKEKAKLKGKKKTAEQLAVEAELRRLEDDEAPKPVSKELKEKYRQETITPSESDFR